MHAKTDMSPELINMVSYLFNGLADRRPTIDICVNHDTNLNNNSRLDALTPIVEANAHPNLFYLRNSGLYEIGNVCIINNKGEHDEVFLDASKRPQSRRRTSSC